MTRGSSPLTFVRFERDFLPSIADDRTNTIEQQLRPTKPVLGAVPVPACNRGVHTELLCAHLQMPPPRTAEQPASGTSVT